jgi:hypothetical protein
LGSTVQHVRSADLVPDHQAQPRPLSLWGMCCQCCPGRRQWSMPHAANERRILLISDVELLSSTGRRHIIHPPPTLLITCTAHRCITTCISVSDMHAPSCSELPAKTMADGQVLDSTRILEARFRFRHFSVLAPCPEPRSLPNASFSSSILSHIRAYRRPSLTHRHHLVSILSACIHCYAFSCACISNDLGTESHILT